VKMLTWGAASRKRWEEIYRERKPLERKAGRPPKVNPVALVAYMYYHNASVAKTAKRFGVSARTVTNARREWGDIVRKEFMRFRLQKAEARQEEAALWDDMEYARIEAWVERQKRDWEELVKIPE